MDKQRQKIERLQKGLANVDIAVRSMANVLDDLADQLADLEGRTCTGNEHWQDQDHPTRAAKMRVLHGLDESCPMHGKPDEGKRLRTYVGSDPENIAAAQRAIENHKKQEELVEQKRNAENRLRSAVIHLEKLYDSLGWKLEPDSSATCVPGKATEYEWRRAW